VDDRGRLYGLLFVSASHHVMRDSQVWSPVYESPIGLLSEDAVGLFYKSGAVVGALDRGFNERARSWPVSASPQRLPKGVADGG